MVRRSRSRSGPSGNGAWAVRGPGEPHAVGLSVAARDQRVARRRHRSAWYDPHRISLAEDGTMTAATIARITNTPRDYAWGQVGGISAALGWQPTPDREAELWLGAHALSPSLAADADGPWSDLSGWEEQAGRSVPFLMNFLAADAPLSLQAHPDDAQAAAGFARENDLGLALTDPLRSYKDPNAKPELVVAVRNGFSALCGFRPLEESLAWLDDLARAEPSPAVTTLRDGVAQRGLREVVAWLLSGQDAVGEVIGAMVGAAQRDPARFALVDLLNGFYPGDPGIAVAQLLNHVVLAEGEALWLPAGNIHAYLSGLGVEVMGPSDNVLRGGLTRKHVDVLALLDALDFTSGPATRLVPEAIGSHALRYRPAAFGAGEGFELLRVTGEALVPLPGPATVLTVGGGFRLTTFGSGLELAHGQAAFVDRACSLRLDGAGLAFIASGA